MMSRSLHLSLLCIILVRSVGAQEPHPQRLTLAAAVDQALKSFPALRIANARAATADAGVDLAKTAYLPRLDLLWQENRASRNNIFGLVLPQSTIPSISGPVIGTTSLTSAWGSAGGMLLSWEPLDFGLRKANMELARAQKAQADAGVSLSRLEVAYAAADAFLVFVGAQQKSIAAQANVDRMQVFSRTVHALVDNQLRPGADGSRADAELAAARTQMILAQQEAETAGVNLSETLGIAGTQVDADPGACLQMPVERVAPVFKLESHPLLQVQAAAVQTEQARKLSLNRTYVPRLIYQFAFFGRGSGAHVDGTIDPSGGLGPDVPNWATGISITFPAFDIFSIRARRKAAAGNELAEQARQDLTLQSLKAQDSRAQILIRAARRIAENTPIQLQAARETLTRARARYEAGLASVVEVSDAERLLTQAEAEDAIARVNVWRALLFRARSEGDIEPFLSQVRNASSAIKP